MMIVGAVEIRPTLGEHPRARTTILSGDLPLPCGAQPSKKRKENAKDRVVWSDPLLLKVACYEDERREPLSCHDPYDRQI